MKQAALFRGAAGRERSRSGAAQAATALGLGFLILVTAMAAGAGLSTPASALTPAIHLGVEGCAGSGCHGNVEASSRTSVMQNEVSVWRARDPHARAWKTLQEPRGQRIARNLGIADAGSAAQCLSCHTDNAPAGQRGQMFRISDGVGCEACHGASTPWLGLHASGIASHGQNVAAGLYPTEQPQARANMCLGCHVGDGSRFVTHEIMAAGHPRLRFELDTYTNTQPPHWRIDADYRARKGTSDRVGTWAAGQIEAADKTLGLIGSRFAGKGGMPELGVFDCTACHKPMMPGSFDAAAGRGVGPGVPRLADANLVMVRVLLQAFDPKAADALRADWVNLHAASRKGAGAVAGAASAVRSRLGAAGGYAGRSYDAAGRRRLAAAFVAEAGEGRLSDYAVAEQATMGLGAIVAGMQESGGNVSAANAALDIVYSTIASEKSFDGTKWNAAVRHLGETLAGE